MPPRNHSINMFTLSEGHSRSIIESCCAGSRITPEEHATLNAAREAVRQNPSRENIDRLWLAQGGTITHHSQHV